jgi:hypothetical protein
MNSVVGSTNEDVCAIVDERRWIRSHTLILSRRLPLIRTAYIASRSTRRRQDALRSLDNAVSSIPWGKSSKHSHVIQVELSKLLRTLVGFHVSVGEARKFIVEKPKRRDASSGFFCGGYGNRARFFPHLLYACSSQKAFDLER